MAIFKNFTTIPKNAVINDESPDENNLFTSVDSGDYIFVDESKDESKVDSKQDEQATLDYLGQDEPPSKVIAREPAAQPALQQQAVDTAPQQLIPVIPAMRAPQPQKKLAQMIEQTQEDEPDTRLNLFKFLEGFESEQVVHKNKTTQDEVYFSKPKKQGDKPIFSYYDFKSPRTLEKTPMFGVPAPHVPDDATIRAMLAAAIQKLEPPLLLDGLNEQSVKKAMAIAQEMGIAATTRPQIGQSLVIKKSKQPAM